MRNPLISGIRLLVMGLAACDDKDTNAGAGFGRGK